MKCQKNLFIQKYNFEIQRNSDSSEENSEKIFLSYTISTLPKTHARADEIPKELVY